MDKTNAIATNDSYIGKATAMKILGIKDEGEFDLTISRHDIQATRYGFNYPADYRYSRFQIERLARERQNKRGKTVWYIPTGGSSPVAAELLGPSENEGFLVVEYSGLNYKMPSRIERAERTFHDTAVQAWREVADRLMETRHSEIRRHTKSLQSLDEKLQIARDEITKGERVTA